MSYGHLSFDNRYGQLSPQFYTRMSAEGIASNPQLIIANSRIAEMIALDTKHLKDPDFAAIFSGNQPLPGGEPLAMVYSGHQFGYWAGQLGDGRALLLGQVRDRHNQLWDIQLKGSGQTPYSRMGDGRAVLRSCVREYLVSIAMAGLGVPTTHALCLVATNNTVMREKPEPGCVLTRIARSHVRFGHFEHLAHHGMSQLIPELLDYLIAEHFPDHTPRNYLAAIIRLTAELIGDWQAIGFAHGVMNTDNMSAIGLTMDYGPYGFLDQCNLGFVCNHSDEEGRYRFDQQPQIAHWNLLALATALKSIIPWEESQELLEEYLPSLMTRYHRRMMRKLGLPATAAPKKIWQDLLFLMHTTRADYTQSFRQLAEWLRDDSTPLPFAHAEGAPSWLAEYRGLCAKHGDLPRIARQMDTENPRYILRNWIAEEVIRALEDEHDSTPLSKLCAVLEAPFAEHPDCRAWQAPPSAEYAGLSVSCSS